jgi:hypothetical protein
MSGNQLLGLVLGVTLTLTSGVVLNNEWARRSQERIAGIVSEEKIKELEVRKFLSDQETSRIKILQEAYASSGQRDGEAPGSLSR